MKNLEQIQNQLFMGEKEVIMFRCHVCGATEKICLRIAFSF